MDIKIEEGKAQVGQLHYCFYVEFENIPEIKVK
jgi:hypothetical protein